MAKVKINGRDLHKVQMRLNCEAETAVAHVSYPEHRIKSEIREGLLVLRIPPLLVIELYRSGILPQDMNLPVRIKIQNKDYGCWKMTGLKYPYDVCGQGLVDIELTKDEENGR